ncbi:MAG: hypothetical protein JWO08_1281 [Verrucomicrobiaceae bacterium]|nr:hypothetical protein [Verrucomicrobiaceae bacterium]
MTPIVLYMHHQLTARDSFVKGLMAAINSLPVRHDCGEDKVGTIKVGNPIIPPIIPCATVFLFHNICKRLDIAKVMTHFFIT